MSRRSIRKIIAKARRNSFRGLKQQIRGTMWVEDDSLIHLPKIYAIKGDDKGRVEVRFESPHQTINAPLDHLRARLIRRFSSNKKHKMNQ